MKLLYSHNQPQYFGLYTVWDVKTYAWNRELSNFFKKIIVISVGIAEISFSGKREKKLSFVITNGEIKTN